MNDTQLQKFYSYSKRVFCGIGEDIFQNACLLALERYHSLENVNQSLFRTLMRESYRNLFKHKKIEKAAAELEINIEDFDNNNLTNYTEIETEIDMQRYAPLLPKYSKIKAKRLRSIYQSKLTPVLPIFLTY
jgi:hypothetical protein